MSKLFKITVCATLFLMITGIDMSAQIGIEAGYINSVYKSKSGNTTEAGDPFNGFSIGINHNINLWKGLSLQPGIAYTFQTDSEKESAAGLSIDGNSYEHNLSIPIMVQYAFDIIPKVGINIFTGPTVYVGLAGGTKININGSLPGIEINGDLNYDYFSGKIKSNNIDEKYLEKINEELFPAMTRFDIGYRLGGGISLFDFLEIKAGYEFGLINRFNTNSSGSDNSKNDLSIHRNLFFISAGFRF